MKTLGLIGGLSWESTAIYYRLINEATKAQRGGLHSAPMLLWSFDFAPIAEQQAAGAWRQLAAVMGEAARRLEAAGAEALVIASNTMHKLYDEVAASVAVPIPHIAEATAAALLARGCRKPILLATRFTMEQQFYRGRLLDRHGIAALVPDAAGRAIVHGVIYGELCRGIVRPESKAAYLTEIEKLAQDGADSVILGCTEIGLLLRPDDAPVPLFDTVIA